MKISDRTFEELAKTLSLLCQKVHKETGLAIGIQFGIMDMDGGEFQTGCAGSKDMTQDDFIFMMESNLDSMQNEKPQSNAGEREDE